MGNLLSAYSINFKGLSLGEHSFEFSLDDSFFAKFEEGEISRGQLVAAVTLKKQNHLLVFKIDIKGSVQVACDRCLELFDLPTTFQGQLVAKIGSGDEENDDEIIFLAEDEHEVNLAQYLYESIHLSLPLQRYHGLNGTRADGCNKEMLTRLNIVSGSESPGGTTDPRWEALKKLKRN